MIWDQFMSRVAAAPDSTAVLTGDTATTYRDLASMAAALSDRLPAGSPTKPRRALVRQREPSSALLHVLACWSRGFVPVVLRDSMTDRQVAELDGFLRPAAVLCEPLPPGPPPGRAPAARAGPGLAPRDEALVICTSGTTGTPKLVALPAESVCTNAATIGAALGLGPADTVGVNTPLGYMYGLMGGCMASLWAGAACCLFAPREPLTQLQAAIRRRGITVVQGPPALFRLFMAYWNGEPFPGVRVLTTGGEPLGTDLAQALRRAFPNARRLFLYGMTEAGPRISHQPFEAGGGEDDCVGLPYPHFEWRIDPIEGELEPAGVGRFVMRGSSMFLGYITAAGGYEGLDAAGFFHSSDLMSVGPTGRLHFRGRLDRIFRSGGRLVNPEAVERVLRMHPAVDDALCFAEPHPILGFVPVAEIVAQSGAAVDPADLLRLCAEHVEPHAIPRRMVSVPPWQLAESGKQRRGVHRGRT